MTREERYQMRLLAGDLTRRLERETRPEERERIERALASIDREKQADRASRPRGKAKKGSRKL